MIRGKLKLTYHHAASGRTFYDKNIFDVACKAWEKRYGKTLQERIDTAAKLKQSKIDSMWADIKPLELELEVYYKKRDQHLSLIYSDLINEISKYDIQMKKAQLAMRLCKTSLRKFKSEGIKEYEEKSPFPNKNKLKNLRSKLYKLL